MKHPSKKLLCALLAGLLLLTAACSAGGQQPQPSEPTVQTPEQPVLEPEKTQMPEAEAPEEPLAEVLALIVRETSETTSMPAA